MFILPFSVRIIRYNLRIQLWYHKVKIASGKTPRQVMPVSFGLIDIMMVISIKSCMTARAHIEKFELKVFCTT